MIRATLRHFALLSAALALFALPLSAAKLNENLASTANGVVEGTFNPETQIRAFKGIPFAAPPVGNLRWREPQPARSWSGVRKADKFGPRAMQRPIFGDMVFRSDGVSEDCLYLNVWTPANSNKEHLPVLVYFYGGGFLAGDGSESRYDGESMARKGIVTVTVNYRLNVFGFLALPELTAESPHHASGNYGLLDQHAALEWVRRNIAAFGGDPKRVTIAGESAGSASVSAQMASPLSKSLIAGAIGESGSLLGALPPVPLAEAEKTGAKFAADCGAPRLTALRAMSAKLLLDATAIPNSPRFPVTIDGYFLKRNPIATFAAGEQAHVPLLVGWNSEEMNRWTVLTSEPTLENFTKAVRKLYGDRADEALKVYAPASAADVIPVATDLASDRFIAYSTWKWADLQGQTGGKPVYRYYYSHPRPPTVSEPGKAGAQGAVHSAEIEYALGNLPGNKVFAWTKDDYRVSETMQAYFANFVKTGDPNGPNLTRWPAANRGNQIQYLRLDVESKVEPERHRDRYLFLDR